MERSPLFVIVANRETDDIAQLAGALSGFGLVVSFDSAESAAQVLRDPLVPDILVVELSRPSRPLWDFMRQVRDSHVHSRVPIVALTPQATKQADIAGVHFVQTNPDNLQPLTRAVRTILARRPAEDPLI